MSFSEIMKRSEEKEITPIKRTARKAKRPTIGPDTSKEAEEKKQKQKARREERDRQKMRERVLYQDTIYKRHKSEQARIQLLQGLREGKPANELLWLALETISNLTAEPVFEENARIWLETNYKEDSPDKK